MGCGGSKPEESAPPPQQASNGGGGKKKPVATTNNKSKPTPSSPKKTQQKPLPAGRPGIGSPPGKGKVGGPGERIKKKPEIKRKTTGKAQKGATIVTDRQKKLKEEYDKQQRIQGDRTDPRRWKVKTVIFSGSAQFMEKGKDYTIKGKSITDGINNVFKKEPMKYYSIAFQTSMVKDKWPSKNHEYKLVERFGTRGYVPKGVSDKGWMTLLINDYERCLPRYPNNEYPMQYRDKYTDHMSYEGRKLHSATNKPIMPGRGMGYGDDPSLKIIGDVDPSDISQGSVGDCWLLSAISALAEFDGAIKRCFRKTPGIMTMPNENGPNRYIVSLYDLPTWKEVDIEIDERLCVKADGSGQLLGAGISEDGELWVSYLEKALAAHCGGWDKIKGGQCTHAWAMLTGCKYQYMIMKNPKTGLYQCFGRYNPSKKEWAPHTNSPHDMAASSMYQMPWPKVGGGGGQFLEIDQEELFMKMCAWDDENYIVGAGTTGSSDAHKTDGMVDNHAYSVIQSINDVAGTDIDLIQVRNPWGSGEIEDGYFDDDGPGWDEYPQIKSLLNPVVADDGLFWVTKQEFFKYYGTIYLSASNMTEFLED